MTKEKAKALELLQKELNEINEVEAIVKREGLDLPCNPCGELFNRFKGKCVIIGLVFDDVVCKHGDTLYYGSDAKTVTQERRK